MRTRPSLREKATERAEQIFRVLDVNGDGNLDEEEFCKWRCSCCWIFADNGGGDDGDGEEKEDCNVEDNNHDYYNNGDNYSDGADFVQGLLQRQRLLPARPGRSRETQDWTKIRISGLIRGCSLNFIIIIQIFNKR